MKKRHWAVNVQCPPGIMLTMFWGSENHPWSVAGQDDIRQHAARAASEVLRGQLVPAQACAVVGLWELPEEVAEERFSADFAEAKEATPEDVALFEEAKAEGVAENVFTTIPEELR